MKVDLHLHSPYSDGVMEIPQMVHTLERQGIRVFSLTDHDTVAGIPEAMKAASRSSMEFIPGIEISCDFLGKEVHVLGYYIDHNNTQLLQALSRFKESRKNRVTAMLGRLAEEKIQLESGEVQRFAHNGVLGRPHIADLMMEKGYVKTRKEAFEKYLSRSGSAYVPREKVGVEQGVALIRGAGGIPVLAHPGTGFLNPSLLTMLEMGIGGIEVFHPDHNAMVIDYYYQFAKRNNLFITAGTDWHGDKPYYTLPCYQLDSGNLDPILQNC